MDSSHEVDSIVRRRMADYTRRAETLRQIHSNKAETATNWSRRYVITTVVVATVVTVFGFMGIDRMTAAASRVEKVSSTSVEAAYSLVVLAILVITILGLVYRFDERSVRHYQSVETLTEFIRDYADLVALSASGVQLLTTDDLVVARTRYKGILSVLPPNTDAEYIRAKESSKEKEAAKERSLDGPKSHVAWADATSAACVEPQLGRELAALMMDPVRRPILQAVRDALGEECWVTGGVVREAAWDQLHNYAVPTPTDDVDVVFFDKNDLAKDVERAMRGRLLALSANVNWSVKNEARMHLVSHEQPYDSLEDAISKFPETATSVAVRLDSGNQLQILAPHGLGDLFELIVRPTVGFDSATYEERLAKKSWVGKWPRLRIVRETGAGNADSASP